MGEGKDQYNPYLRPAAWKIKIEENIPIGTGSFGKVDYAQTTLVGDDIEIPVRVKTTKTFDLPRFKMYFDHEVAIMERLKKMKNKYTPILFEVTHLDQKGCITMEKIGGINSLAIVPDPQGEVVIDIAQKMAEAINQTFTDGVVDTDPKIDSYRIEIDSLGRPLKVRLLDLGLYFFLNNKYLHIPDKFILPYSSNLAPELIPYTYKKKIRPKIDAERLAVHNLGYNLISMITPPEFWVHAISSYKDGVFDRLQFENDVLASAKTKGFAPLDIQNDRVIQILDLIEDMLKTEPRARPTFSQVFKRLKNIKGSNKVVPCIISFALENLARKNFFPDRTYVVDEKKVMEKLEDPFR